MRRRDAVPARENLFRALRLAGGVVHRDDPRLFGLVVCKAGGETEAARVEQAHSPNAPPVAATHEVDHLFVCSMRVQTHRKTMFRGGARDPPRGRDGVHEAIEVALTEPGDLAAATANDAFVRIVGNHEVAGAERLDRHGFDLCGLAAGAAINDLLNHRAGGLARFVLPVVVSPADDQAGLVPDDLRAHGESARLEALDDDRSVESAVPDVGHRTREQLPRLAPVSSVIVEHGAGGQLTRSDAKRSRHAGS
jgi:hypothetical protein